MVLRLPCGSASFCRIRHSLGEFLENVPLEEEHKTLVILAVDEACANVLVHAYGKNPERPIRLRFEHLPRSLRITIRDYGKSCEPDKICGRDLRDFRPGGLGVHLIRQAFDRVSYEPRKRGTRLVLVKAFVDRQRRTADR